MMRKILLACSLACSPVALAQQHDHTTPACAAMDASLPAGFADWNGGARLATAGKAAYVTETRVQIGKGYSAILAPTTSIVMTVPPEKPGGSVSFSGVFHLDVETAGNYAVALGGAAWIDVVEGDKALEPVSFGHGPECTTIRKMVVYGLKPGHHLLQVAGHGGETTKLLVAKQP